MLLRFVVDGIKKMFEVGYGVFGERQ